MSDDIEYPDGTRVSFRVNAEGFGETTIFIPLDPDRDYTKNPMTAEIGLQRVETGESAFPIVTKVKREP